MNKYDEQLTGESIEETIRLADFCKECDLQILSGDADDCITFKSVLVNRPGLLFAGFEDYFESSRVQVIGNAEYYYLASLTGNDKENALAKNAICKYSRATPTIVLRSSLCLSIDRVYCLQALKIISKAVECR